ncbi:hopanoid biosynthesis-associated protein HpnK [Chlorogloeopsis sp. ULAP01]|uniref:hopanoid biosynthesis-associated protein HpnK n=1 Tax=Chlorogloeopsis sp. ULAP01 TaxID=3056483 RepID=UPI0025AB3514|nr:hopanoid biosynthesis-associated protein HpnK [Chlorogloeopsis sp. ULAP01]MDM9383704.1 hopanoid biosynthesis-associated protein HpnK [Chlorogloeopsis sp. ULAP01]
MQAKKFAIINGDDFGFSSSVNQAIIKAHAEGVLTSTSLMVTADAAHEAVALARTHPNLAVGLHLVLVCGKSALPPQQIPHLVDKEGNFFNDSLLAGLRYQFVRKAREELRQEIRAQLEKFRSTGLPLSHVDGHLHMHMHPVVLGILTDLAAEFNIKAIRLPFEELGLNLKHSRSKMLTKLVWSVVFGRLRHYGEHLLESQGISFTQKVYGLLQTGNITEKYLLELIPQIRAELVEIYCHPELSGAGEVELAALLSSGVREVLASHGFELTNYYFLPDRTLLD